MSNDDIREQIAKIIYKHTWDNYNPGECDCGIDPMGDHALHQADALLPWVAKLIEARERKAAEQGWDEGQRAAMKHVQDQAWAWSQSPDRRNPYRADEKSNLSETSVQGQR